MIEGDIQFYYKQIIDDCVIMSFADHVSFFEHVLIQD